MLAVDKVEENALLIVDHKEPQGLKKEVTLESQKNFKNLEKSQLLQNDKQEIKEPQGTTEAVQINENRDRIRMELQPLNLKKNYDNHQGNLNSHKVEKNCAKDRTPGQDLLEW